MSRSRSVARGLVLGLVTLLVLLCANLARAQAGAPPAGAACVVSAGNRNAPLAADGSYTVFGIPGNLGAIRARATCSDGSVGQSAIGFTNPFEPATIPLGPIVFGTIDPVPVVVTLSAPTRFLTTGQTAQMTATAVGIDGASYDVTPRTQGTVYSISNELLATVSENGEVRIYPQFAEGSSSRVVVSSISEGGVASTYMFVLGPRGTMTGTVTASDGVTPVAGAEVSVLRLQPMEQAGTATTDPQGQFRLEGVSAGNFLVSAIAPATGDRAIAHARLGTEGQVVDVALRLNGLGTVEVTVLDALDQPVPATEVSFTALGNFRDVRALATGANGIAGFANVAAGDFTVSARDPATRLIGTAVARLAPGQVLPVTLKLQPIGEIHGRVLDVDGATPRAGVQVRVISRQRGILTQMLSGADGSFAFDTLPLSDGPYTLDAFVDGRLRARLPGTVLSVPNAIVTRDIVLSPSGTVLGEVRRGGSVVADALVRLQSLEGLRLAFETRADAQGRFRFPAVPVGDLEIQATAPNGQNARVAGRVSADGEQVVLDVVIADDTLAGTVFQRDGVTPVGAGVAVYLAPKSLGTRYTYDGVAGVQSTETDAEGRFGFVVAATGTYFVQAEQALERGRSESVVVNLNPAQPLESRVVFLAKGTVRGQVRDVGGAPQADVPVTVRSEGPFTLDRTTRTGPDGRYQVDGVFIGDLTASARNEATQLSGISEGRLNAEGDQVVLDITLAATARMSGTVLKRQGGAATGPVRVSVRRDGSPVASQEFPTAAYQFDLVPVGDIEVTAEELGTGDRGVATARIAGAGDDKVLDVRLVGQGQLDVLALDDSGQPVADARITVGTAYPFASTQEVRSDASGRATFARVFAGDYTVSANKPLALGTLSGSASGTMLPGATQAVTVTLQNLVIGIVEGQLLQPDGVTPAAAGWVIRMLPEPFRDAFVTTTDAEGRFRFAEVPGGSYTIDAMRFYTPLSCPQRDRIRARAAGVSVTTQGATTTVSMTLIGQGRVRGRVTNAAGTPVPAVRVTMTNPDPVYGANVSCGGQTTFVRSTGANGDYLIEDAPPGDFTIVATTAGDTQRAEGAGRVRFDGDEAVVDLELVDSAVTLPMTLHDANGFRFDIQGNGSIGTGTNNVFAGTAPDNAGMRLELVRDGVAVPFVNGNGTIGRLGGNGQRIDVDDTTASGLLVRREVYVPRAGYFARYLEVLENPGTTPVTVDVVVRAHHRPAQANPRVVDTSDGDQVLNVAGAARDRWAVVDDQLDADPFANGGSIPATAHVFDGEGAPVQVASAAYDLIGQSGRLVYRWNGITVPAGGTVRLMHVVLSQIDRFSARAAAMRVSTLPPEVLDDLTTEERQTVLNFVLPESSAVAPLPNLDAGDVRGRVFSGDGVTPVPNAEVRFRSKHPLFGRVRYRNTDAEGRFGFRSTLDGTVNNYVIPVFGFDLSARYPVSHAASAVTPGEFPADATRVEQDLVFVGQGDVRGNVKRHNQSALAGATVRLCRLPSRGVCSDVAPNPSNQATSAADGSFLMLANPPRDYFLFAHKAHPQATRNHGARPILGEGIVSVTAGDIAVADVTMEPTGSIAGQVLGTDGTPVVGAYVEIAPLPGPAAPIRGTATDTFGRYRFFDVPLGDYRVYAEDPSSNAQGTGEAMVTVDTEAVANITLRPFGLVRVQVNHARGIPADNAWVQLGTLASGTTDTNGRISLQAPEGSHSVRAYHPDSSHPQLQGTTMAVITTPGEIIDVTVTLGAAGNVSGTIVRPDGSTLANGFPYLIRRIGGGSAETRDDETSATGAFRENGLPLGQYLLTAYDAGQDRYIDAEFAITADGEEVVLDLVLLENRIALPADLIDANRFRFDVQRSGALAIGSGGLANAARLSVDGIAYTGETSARLEADRRQFLIAQPAPIAGLAVSRRIHVPRGAYYARYLEILENPTAESKTVSVTLAHRLEAGGVIASSSGDAQADAADHWVAIDDAVDEDILLDHRQVAPTAFVFGADGALLHPTAVSIQPAGGKPELTARYDGVTVPAGGRVVLMHFIVQQVHRTGLNAAIDRLRQLPPEALANLAPEDHAAIRNFTLPEPGVATVPALPALTASISGIALEGDVRTPVRGARVTMQSAHPLFNRVWGMQPDPDYLCPPGTAVGSLVTVASVPPNQQNPPPLGRFSLAGQLTAVDSIALPEGVPVRVTAQEPRPCFGRYRGHSWTGVPSRVETVVPSATRDLVFDTGVLTGTTVGAADFSVTSGRMYLSTDDPDSPVYRYIPIAADGTWTYPGLLPGNYDVLFDTRHPDATGQDILRGQRPGARVDLAQITVTDVDLQPTGRIQGAVVSFTGEQSVGARVLLSGPAAGQSYDQCASGCIAETLAKHRGKRLVSREVLTDSLGRYAFAAVPVGAYTLTVIDPISDGRTTATLEVTDNQTTVRNVTLLPLGRAELTVLTRGGQPAVDAHVYLNADAQGFEKIVGRTDFMGRLTVANIAAGNYTLRVRDPRHPNAAYLDRTVSGTITMQGQVDPQVVTLRAVANLAITVINGAVGSPGISGARVRLADGRGTMSLPDTNAQGQTSALVVPEGTATVRASATIANVLREGEVPVVIDAAVDNQTVPVTVNLADAQVPLPRFLHDANRSGYYIGPNGSGDDLPTLTVAGTPFTGAASAAQQLGQRQFAITQATPIAGLRVSRKVFVPRQGYAARFLEVLENEGTEPVQVDAVVASPIPWNMFVDTTSDGDAVVNADLWVTLRYSGGGYQQARALVYGDDTLRAPVLERVVIEGWPYIRATWPNLVVPAGGKRVLMHFVADQWSRTAATASAQRLLQLPPEALDGLVAEGIANIPNFAVPVDGQSALAPLPDLQGVAGGRVLEGDGSAIAGVEVRIRSQHPLYVREWRASDVASLRTDAAGNFSVAGVLRDDDESLPIPVDVPLDLTAVHPNSNVTATATGTFSPEGTLVQDVVFNSAVLVGRITGAFQHPVMAGPVRVGTVAATRMAADGQYRIGGVTSGTYTVSGALELDDGDDLPFSVPNVVLNAGSAHTLDVVLPPNGALRGVVRAASGAPVAGVTVRVTVAGMVRQVLTDVQGQYAFSALRAGDAVIRITDPGPQSQTEFSQAIVADQEIVRDIDLPAVGRLNIVVRHARGAVAADVPVYLSAPSVTGQVFLGWSNAQGEVSALAPVGPVTLHARHPLTDVETVLEAVLAEDGQVLPLAIDLAPAARFDVTVGNLGAAVASARVQVRRQSGPTSTVSSGTTDATGLHRTSWITGGAYFVSAAAPAGLVVSPVTVDAANDGQTIPLALALDASPSASAGVFRFDGERHLHGMFLEAGDRVAVMPVGAPVDGSSALCSVRVSVHAPDATRIAEGTGGGPNSYTQTNLFGDLRAIEATTTGRHFVLVRRESTGCPVGGYRLFALRNGQPHQVDRFVGGGRVEGNVFAADGVTPVPDGIVRVRTFDNLAIHEQVRTDALGRFEFPSVRLGSFELTHWPSEGGNALVTRSGSIDSAGQVVVINLVRPPTTQVVATVVADGQPLPGAVVTFFNQQAWAQRTAGEDGTASYSYRGEMPLNVRAQHPTQSGLAAATVVQPEDGATRNVTIDLSQGSIEGFVRDAAGNPVPFVGIEAVSGNNVQVAYDQSDADGRYRFETIAAGAPVELRARDPENQVQAVETVTAIAGQTVQRDIVLPARGTIELTVVNTSGQPLRNAYGFAEFETRIGSGDVTTHGYGTTDDDGRQVIEAVPVGRTITVKAEYYGSGGGSRAPDGGDNGIAGGGYWIGEVEVTLDAAGQAVPVTIELDVPSTTFVRGTLVRADGLAVDGYCYLYLEPGNDEGNYGEGDCGDWLSIEDVPAGEHQASFVVDGNPVGGPLVTVAEGEDTEFTHVLSIVRGQVRHPDGAVVAEAYVSSTDANGEYRYTTADVEGRFLLLGLPEGAFTIRAEDPASGLAGDASGTLPDASQPFDFDVVMPASGTVSGTVRDAAAQAVPFAEISMRSLPADIARSTSADDQGRYAFERVPTGTVDVVGVKPGTALHGAAASALAAHGDTLVMDIALPVPGSISGALADAGTPMADHCVELRSQQTAFGLGELRVLAQTDGTGAFGFAEVAPGAYSVLAAACTNADQGAVAHVDVLASQVTQAPLAFGTGMVIPRQFADPPSGLTHYIGGEGAYGAWRMPSYRNYAFSVGPYLELRQPGALPAVFPYRTIAGRADAGRTIELGPARFGDLVIRRHIHVPVAGGFVRVLETVTNTGAAPVTPTLSIHGEHGSAALLTPAPPLLPGHYAVQRPDTADSYYAPAVTGYVFGSAGASVPAVPDFADGRGAFSYGWAPAIAPGQTVSLLHFWVLADPADPAIAVTRAQSLSTLAEPGMFDGLTSDQRARILNFTVPTR